MTTLSLAQAQRIAVTAQRLDAPPAGARRRAPQELLADLGCIQIDTINVVRRSHELVLLARGGEAGAAAAALGVEEPSCEAFEYYGHAASFLPIRHWPLFALRRRQFRAGRWTGPAIIPEAVEQVRDRIHGGGPVTVRDLGGSQGAGWERTSPLKWAAEWLLATGELACVRRRSWMREYDLAARVIPDQFRHDELSDEACARQLCGIALDALGVATIDDIADYFRLPKPLAAAAVKDLPDVVEVAVESWDAPGYATAACLEDDRAELCDNLVALSPFDSLIWHRPRMARLFGVAYKLEAYLPAAKRECGYFALPVLHGHEIIGRVAMRCGKGHATIEGVQARDATDIKVIREAAERAAAWAHATVDSAHWQTAVGSARVGEPSHEVRQ